MSGMLSFLSCLMLITTVGCVRRAENEVVVYTALDQEFSAPIFAAFHRSTDGTIQPAAKFDVESTKTVGLVNQIIAERDRPAADVFWNNEILHTIRLQKMGLLQPHNWKLEAGYPADMFAADGTWCGFAARGRVLLINTDRLTDPSEYPASVDELAALKWKGRCAVARPLFGTTATHAAVIRQIKGADTARHWFADVAANAVVLSGNKQVALAVASGQVDWGLTDTDDAVIERDARRPVAIVFPDQQTDQLGTLRIPNTVAILKGAPHPIAAATLVDFLVTPRIEDRLAMGGSAQLPISRQAEHRPRVLGDTPVRWMRVDFEAAAEDWDELAAELIEIFK
jgi:iron(III) transport system substrate-binding protein